MGIVMAVRLRFSLLRFFVLCIILPQLKVEGKQNLINLDEDNWRDMLEGEWMVEFEFLNVTVVTGTYSYAPWCPACKSLQPVWNDFSNSSKLLKIKVGQVDVTTSPGLSGRFMVTALPTIYHVIKGEFRQYKGGREKEALVSFIKDKKWAQIEPIPSWQSPSSFLRSIVSYFFKLSTILRLVHNHLIDEYGIPAWGSYLALAVATIFVGTFLGLILVCIIDCISPPKTSTGKLKPLKKEEIEEVDEVDDIIDESGDNAESMGRQIETKCSQYEKETEDVIKNSPDEEEIKDVIKNSQDEEEKDDVEREQETDDEKQEKNPDQNKGVRKRKPIKAM